MPVQDWRTLPSSQLAFEVNRGGRFVVFQYCVSIVVITFRKNSAVQFVPAGESAVVKGLPYSLLTLVAGWWGIPWGPIFTIGSLIVNFRGGKDITSQVAGAIKV